MKCPKYDLEITGCSMQGDCKACLNQSKRHRFELSDIPGHFMICRKEVDGNVRKDVTLICPKCLIALTYQAKEQGEDYDREAFLAKIMGKDSQNEGVLLLEALPASTASLNRLKDDSSVLDEKYLGSETSEQINHEEVQNYGN